ncbi:MAG: hypothetical protein HYW27_03600 [Candidatus Aenigmarchaeota archaeon]|nr:hypothetical protein [Candidatus Aenigmarchaeota archaeon]
MKRWPLLAAAGAALAIAYFAGRHDYARTGYDALRNYFSRQSAETFREVTQEDLDRIFPPNSRARARNVWVDKGIACDMDGDGQEDYIVAETSMRGDERGFVEFYDNAAGEPKKTKGMRFFTQGGYERAWGDDPADEGQMAVYSYIRGALRMMYTTTDDEGVWNFSCDTLFADDIDGDGSQELFAGHTSGLKVPIKTLGIYRWSRGRLSLVRNFSDADYTDIDEDGEMEVVEREVLYGDNGTPDYQRHLVRVYEIEGGRFVLADMKIAVDSR